MLNLGDYEKLKTDEGVARGLWSFGLDFKSAISSIFRLIFEILTVIWRYVFYDIANVSLKQQP